MKYKILLTSTALALTLPLSALALPDNPLWTKTVAAAGAISGLAVDKNGEVIVGWQTMARTALTKFSSDGVALWTVGMPKAENPFAITTDQNRNVISVGMDSASYNTGQFLLKSQKPDGKLTWKKAVSPVHDSLITSVTSDNLNNIYLGGWLQSGDTVRGIILKYSPAGVELRRTMTPLYTVTGLSTDQWNNLYTVTRDISSTPKIYGTYLDGYRPDGSKIFPTREVGIYGHLFRLNITTGPRGYSYIPYVEVPYPGAVPVVRLQQYAPTGASLWNRTASRAGEVVIGQPTKPTIDTAGTVYGGYSVEYRHQTAAGPEFVVSPVRNTLYAYTSLGVEKWRRPTMTYYGPIATGVSAAGNLFVLGESWRSSPGGAYYPLNIVLAKYPK